jgi:hypothetical protein
MRELPLSRWFDHLTERLVSYVESRWGHELKDPLGQEWEGVPQPGPLLVCFYSIYKSAEDGPPPACIGSGEGAPHSRKRITERLTGHHQPREPSGGRGVTGTDPPVAVSLVLSEADRPAPRRSRPVPPSPRGVKSTC